MQGDRRGIWALSVLASLLLAAPCSLAQSQAANGTIQGTVLDASGEALAGVQITLANIDTGFTEVVTSDGAGTFRALLLPLGAYRLKAELSGFRGFERAGLQVNAGTSAVVNFTLAVGDLTEVVVVTADTPVTEPGRVDLGRTLGEAELRNLPLVSRNPYNFALLQPNVTGFENDEFGVPRLNANGSQMRTNYQIDGNTNTQKDRAGLRLLPVSEVTVREVRVVTNGFAPEFGQTTGMVYNAVTPSGSNDWSGSLSYRLRRKSFSSLPFFLPATAKKPDTFVNNWTGSLGGPILKDKWHFYVGGEYVDRNLSADRVITVSRATAAALGLSANAVPESGVMPTIQKTTFLVARSDYQFSARQRLVTRYLYFNNDTSANIGGGLNTTERATDQADKMHSLAVQLVSTFGSGSLNELRAQFSQRRQARQPSENAVSGPAITVSGLANFGGPLSGSAADDAGFVFQQRIWQVVDSLTLVRGRHSFKLGADLQRVQDERRNSLFQLYTFPSLGAYLDARNGTNPLSYSSFAQRLGDPNVAYDSTFLGVYVQDDLLLNANFKLLYGLRYDLFVPPPARSFAANPASAAFKTDKNNLAPRIGFSWSLDPAARTVVRASTGIMYEPPLLNFYEDAIQSNGDPRSVTVALNPSSTGAPRFPGNLANTPPGFSLPRQSVVAIDPDFRTQWALLSNVQVERALADDMSVAVGFVHSLGRNLPVLVDLNLIPTGQTLADGRPIYSTAVNSQTRSNTAFDHVNTVRSLGRSTYTALTLSLNKRLRQGVQFQASYTLARARDNAPLTGTYIVGSADDRLSDPSNVDRDEGPTPFNQKHTFVASALIAPHVDGAGFGARLLNDNQLALIVQWNSGLPFNVRSNRDLNQDGVLSDRPLGVERNSEDLGRVFNVDARYSRFVRLHGDLRVEFFAEAKNLFDVENVASVNRVVATDTVGNLITPLPDRFPATGGYQQRRLQFGGKLTF